MLWQFALMLSEWIVLKNCSSCIVCFLRQAFCLITCITLSNITLQKLDYHWYQTAVFEADCVVQCLTWNLEGKRTSREANKTSRVSAAIAYFVFGRKDYKLYEINICFSKLQVILFENLTLYTRKISIFFITVPHYFIYYLNH